MKHELYASLLRAFEANRATELDGNHIKYADILPLIQELKNFPECEVKPIGESAEGRDIYQISIGRGEKKALLWSQMHGDEPTATRVLFDLFNFLLHDGTGLADELLNAMTLHVIPMLNPDGAERVWRYNAWGIDLNRDAKALQTPEARLLRGTMEVLRPHYGFNLHDQYSYYSTGLSPNPASISFLANPVDMEGSLPSHRKESMQLIVYANRGIQALAPNQVGRYVADFDPTSFGDTSQTLGICTMLIESGGGGAADRQRMQARRLNFVAILLALHGIATGAHFQEDHAQYEQIPYNKLRLFDLLLKNVACPLPNGRQMQIDIGVNQSKQVWHGQPYLKGSVVNFGDLSGYNGLQELDCTGLDLKWPNAPKAGYKPENALEWLQNGDLFALGKHDLPYSSWPVNLAAGKIPEPMLERDAWANFLLGNRYAVMNGFLVDFSKGIEDDIYGLAV